MRINVAGPPGNLVAREAQTRGKQSLSLFKFWQNQHLFVSESGELTSHSPAIESFQVGFVTLSSPRVVSLGELSAVEYRVRCRGKK